MAGFMDMLGKRPETESGSSYQRTVLREVARKLNDLEEQNEQNALAIEEVRKLQKNRTAAAGCNRKWTRKMVLADGREQGISVPGQRALMTCRSRYIC